MRRVFATTSSAPAYSYDPYPYGNALQGTAPLTDFNYAGMFYNADSGLYLTQYRAYDPVSGRWLSRDPMGESSDLAANLYRYVEGNPISLVDPRGLAGITPDPNGVVPGGPWTPAGPGQRPGTFYGPPQPSGGRDTATWVPTEQAGGPSGSQGYWKFKTPDTDWQRFNTEGAPISPEEAHPSTPFSPIIPFTEWPSPAAIVLGVIGTVFCPKPAY